MPKIRCRLFWVLLLSALASDLRAQTFPAFSSVYTHYTADNTGNVTAAPLSQTFTAANVDMVNHKLTGLPDLGFPSVAKAYATPVYFSTTGTLPAPLSPNIPYYVVGSVAEGYSVYPLATDADAPYQPGAGPGEKVQIAQNVYLGVRKIVFTSGGSGTHTLSSRKLLSQLTDLTANGFHSVAPNLTNRHAMLEMGTDANGKWYFKTLGAIARENWVGSYNGYGPTFYQSGDRYAARQQIGNKRVVYQIFVCRVRSFKERQVMKVLNTPSRIDIATNRVNYGWDSRMSGKVATGDLLRVSATAGNSLPAPLAEGTDYYARKVDNVYFTLHPSATDAANNTNVIDLTSAGSGSFLFYSPLRVGDARRWSFFAEVLEPGSGGGNTLSARLQEPMPSGASILKNASAFTVTGGNNGNVSNFSGVADLTPVVFWTPPGATLPAPLQAGTRYWISKSAPTSGSARLHANLAGAQAGVGLSTSASGCIKFTAAGTGESLVSQDDDATAIGYGTLASVIEPPPLRVPFGELCILVFKIDFNDPDSGVTNAIASLGLNEAVTATRALSFAKGNTPAAVQDTAKAWTLFNSAQGHVPIDLDCYEIIFGSTESADPTDDIQVMVDYLKAKYKIGESMAAPIPPSGASAVAGDGRITLSWQVVPGAASYRIKAGSSASGPFFLVASVDAPEVSYLATNLTNGTTYFYTVSAVNSHGESADSSVISAVPTASLVLTGAVSRKTHGSAGSLDVPISVSYEGKAPVEPRMGSALTLVATFDKELSACEAEVGMGTATLSSPVAVSGKLVTIKLTDVADAQTVQINLSNITGADGGILASAVLRVAKLPGDASGDGVVSSGDINLVKSRSGQTASSSNLGCDLNADGVVSSGDVNLAKNRSGTFVP